MSKHSNRKKVILFGSGYMANEYLKALKDLDCDVVVFARNEEKAKRLAQAYGFAGFGGGVQSFKNYDCKDVQWVINAVSINALKDVTCACLQKGMKNILVEKPGAFGLDDLLVIKGLSNGTANIRIAYNRRFYNSVLQLEKEIEKDGGAIGCFFDFTERKKDLENNKEKDEMKHWGLANSSHVIDLAFFLVGLPNELSVCRDGSWEFHPSGNVFTGSGRTEKCLFSYFSAWSGGGRWNVEVATKKGRYKLSPLEALSFCKIDQFQWEDIPLNDLDDQKYKPGIYKLVKNVIIDGRCDQLADLDYQIEFCKVVNQIFGYEN